MSHFFGMLGEIREAINTGEKYQIVEIKEATMVNYVYLHKVKGANRVRVELEDLDKRFVT